MAHMYGSHLARFSGYGPRFVDLKTSVQVSCKIQFGMRNVPGISSHKNTFLTTPMNNLTSRQWEKKCVISDYKVWIETAKPEGQVRKEKSVTGLSSDYYSY
jgi:hypothetical protein